VSEPSSRIVSASRGTLQGVTLSDEPDPASSLRLETAAAVAQQIAEEHCGATALRVRHNAFGHRSLTFTVVLTAQTVIVRLNLSPAAFATTVQNIEVLRELTIPAPEVLAADSSCSRYPFAYMILRAIPGADLRFALPAMSQRQQERVAHQVVEFQRRVASLPEGRGYGYAGIGESPIHRTWREAIAFGAFSQAYVPNTTDLALVTGVERAVGGLAAYLDDVRPTCFLDDLTTKNVIVDDGVLQGVVDLDVVCYGDPLFQIGLTQTAVGFDLPEKCMSYVEYLCAAAGVGPDRRRVIDLYAALCGVDFLSRIPVGAEHRDGVALVESWLDRSELWLSR
jgi:aminoglycoside phosphotransferase (APT) family kinase protein